MSEQLDRKDLKIKALLQKIGHQAANYEDQIAELRVEITVKESEWEQQVLDLQQQVQDLQHSTARTETPPDDVDYIVQGDVENVTEDFENDS